MNKVLAFVLALTGLSLAGSASADMSGPISSTAPVNVAVMDKTGNTVRLFAPEGNRVLCRGDYIAVYDSDIKVPAGRLTPSSPWEATVSPGAIFGRTPSTFGTTEFGTASVSEFRDRLSSTDVNNLALIGEVRVDNLIGDSYADGVLIRGDVLPGDIASKPSAQCQPQPVLPQG